MGFVTNKDKANCAGFKTLKTMTKQRLCMVRQNWGTRWKIAQGLKRKKKQNANIANKWGTPLTSASERVAQFPRGHRILQKLQDLRARYGRMPRNYGVFEVKSYRRAKREWTDHGHGDIRLPIPMRQQCQEQRATALDKEPTRLDPGLCRMRKAECKWHAISPRRST